MTNLAGWFNYIILKMFVSVREKLNNSYLNMLDMFTAVWFKVRGEVMRVYFEWNYLALIELTF